MVNFGMLPKATAFKLRIPPELTSICDEKISGKTEFEFQTPKPALAAFHPSGRCGMWPVIVLGFNQQVNRDAVVQMVQVLAKKEVIPVRLATPEEINSDPTIPISLNQYKLVHLRTVKPLLPGTQASIKVPVGV
jgi:hypothetical protein